MSARMAFFRSLQASAFTDWFLGSDSIWTYPTVLTLHTVGMAMLVGASVVVALRLLNVGSDIPLRRLLPLYRIIWIGFGINLVSGIVLFVTEAADRVVDPVFYVKLASIALALWVGILIRRRALAAPDAGMARGSSRAIAAASLSLWTVAIVAGRLMAYLKK
jgi:hypothetical protein